jgi:hypothetical protein
MEVFSKPANRYILELLETASGTDASNIRHRIYCAL